MGEDTAENPSLFCLPEINRSLSMVLMDGLILSSQIPRNLSEFTISQLWQSFYFSYSCLCAFSFQHLPLFRACIALCFPGTAALFQFFLVFPLPPLVKSAKALWNFKLIPKLLTKNGKISLCGLVLQGSSKPDKALCSWNTGSKFKGRSKAL